MFRLIIIDRETRIARLKVTSFLPDEMAYQEAFSYAKKNELYLDEIKLVGGDYIAIVGKDPLPMPYKVKLVVSLDGIGNMVFQTTIKVKSNAEANQRVEEIKRALDGRIDIKSVRVLQVHDPEQHLYQPPDPQGTPLLSQTPVEPLHS